MGKVFFEEVNSDKSYKYFELSDSAEGMESTKDMLETLTQYEIVVVFHGKFKDILHQILTWGLLIFFSISSCPIL